MTLSELICLTTEKTAQNLAELERSRQEFDENRAEAKKESWKPEKYNEREKAFAEQIEAEIKEILSGKTNLL